MTLNKQDRLRLIQMLEEQGIDADQYYTAKERQMKKLAEEYPFI